MSWAGWAGQVRLAGYAFIFSPIVVVVVVVVDVLLLSLLLFLGFVRWFLDVSFHITFLRIIVIMERDTVIFGAQNLSFGRPGASTLAPWGTMGRSRGTWEYTTGHLGVQAWNLIDLGLIL